MTKTRNVLNLSAGGVRGGEECKVFVYASCDHVQPYGCMDEAQEGWNVRAREEIHPWRRGACCYGTLRPTTERTHGSHTQRAIFASHPRPKGVFTLTPTPRTKGISLVYSPSHLTPTPEGCLHNTHARRVSSHFTPHTQHPLGVSAGGPTEPKTYACRCAASCGARIF